MKKDSKIWQISSLVLAIAVIVLIVCLVITNQNNANVNENKTTQVLTTSPLKGKNDRSTDIILTEELNIHGETSNKRNVLFENIRIEYSNKKMNVNMRIEKAPGEEDINIDTLVISLYDIDGNVVASKEAKLSEVRNEHDEVEVELEVAEPVIIYDVRIEGK